MLNYLKKAWKWIRVNIKLVLLLFAIASLFIFIFWLSSKNRKIRKLENELMILKSKFKIEKLSIKHDVAVNELKHLKEEDEEVREKLYNIEKELEEKLKEDMTAEEMANRFKELGL